MEISSDAAARVNRSNVARAMELNEIACRLDDLEQRLSERGSR
jgi:hypothetical protein